MGWLDRIGKKRQDAQPEGEPKDGTVEKYSLCGVEFRVVWTGGKPWAVADDMATGLGYDQASRITRHVSDSEYLIRNHPVVTNAGTRYYTLISKRGVLDVFMTVNTERTKPFRKAVLDLLEAIDEGRVRIVPADDGPAKLIGPTAARAMKRNGLGLAWGEDRQDHCDKNRLAVGLLWKLIKEDAEKKGRKPSQKLFAAFHDALTEGATWMNTAQCLRALGIEKGTPLDYLDSLPLATRNHMLTALIEGFKSGEITLENAAAKFEAIKRAARAIPGAVYGSDFRCVVDRDKADVPLLTYRSAIQDQRRRYCAQ